MGYPVEHELLELEQEIRLLEEDKRLMFAQLKIEQELSTQAYNLFLMVDPPSTKWAKGQQRWESNYVATMFEKDTWLAR